MTHLDEVLEIPTLEEIKEHFKDAKKVRFYEDLEGLEIDTERFGIYKSDCNCYRQNENEKGEQILLWGTGKYAEIIEYKSGIKETDNRIDYSEINFNLVDLMAKRFNDNKHKYPKGNMLKDIDVKELENATFRHLRKMMQPIENDSESYKDHLTAVACNVSMILTQIEKK